MSVANSSNDDDMVDASEYAKAVAADIERQKQYIATLQDLTSSKET